MSPEPYAGHTEDVEAYQTTRQWTTEDLAAADPNRDPQAIVDAHRRGQLNTLIGLDPPPHHPIADQLGLEDVERMTDDQIVHAQADGRLDRLLGKQTGAQ